jgi:peptide deformylase
VTVRNILLMGNPSLLKISAPVDDPTSPEIKALLQDMRDTLDSVSGIGLAAPQIDVPLRVVLFCLPANRIPAGAQAAPVPWTAMINPVIEPLDSQQVLLWERCLSLPGLYAQVPRFNHIRITYQDADGTRVTRKCRGYLATLLQHECDHLDGTLYPMRMTDMRMLSFATEVCGPRGVYAYEPTQFDG